MDDNEDHPTNVFQIGAIRGGKTEEVASEEVTFPINDYTVVDVDGSDWYATGFLVFTPHHVAVMKKTGQGAVPGLVIPINRVKAAFIDEDVSED